MFRVMSLAVIGRDSSCEFRWRRWALLCDTLGTFDQTQGRFPLLASIGRAMNGPLRIPARELASEIRAVQQVLSGRPVTQLAISPATAAILYMGARLEQPRPLTARELEQVAPPGTSLDLAEYFASTCDAIAAACSAAFDDDCVEVIDL
jgi:hypothetical protein